MDARIARTARSLDEPDLSIADHVIGPADPQAFAAAVAAGFEAIERGDVLTDEHMEREFDRMLADLPRQ